MRIGTQTEDEEKTFANYISDKRPIHRLNKGLQYSTVKNHKQF
jgi:hypothetical protein